MIQSAMRFALLFVFLLGCATHGEARPTDADRALAFANHLFTAGDYYRAITEYERVIFYHGEDRETVATARFQIALAYQKGRQWAAAGEQFRALADSYAGSAHGARALFLLGETYYLQQDYTLAADAYDELLSRYPQADDADSARLRRGVCYLQLRRWELAATEFRATPPASPSFELTRQLADATDQYPDIPRKSPAVAAGLSAVLPGAGQLYVKRPKDALTSFLLNGLFIWGAVESFDHGNPVVGGILTAIESSWYAGNIYNAASSAHKYNRYQEQQFIDNLQAEFGLAWMPGAHDGHSVPLLAVRLHF